MTKREGTCVGSALLFVACNNTPPIFLLPIERDGGLSEGAAGASETSAGGDAGSTGASSSGSANGGSESGPSNLVSSGGSGNGFGSSGSGDDASTGGGSGSSGRSCGVCSVNQDCASCGAPQPGYVWCCAASTCYEWTGACPSASAAEAGPPLVVPLAPVATPGDVLPFTVDAHFVPSGYMGDFLQVRNAGDATGAACGTRSSPSAAGDCYVASYTPPASGGQGWGGVAWQYPVNNWGSSPGYLIPAGATNVTLYARGKVGGEALTFGVGGIIPNVSSPYADAVTNFTQVTLTTTWTAYTIPLNGQTYAAGQIIAFQWDVAAPPASVPVQFFVDDIKWQ